MIKLIKKFLNSLLTPEQIEARMDVYDEAIGHLNLLYGNSDTDSLEREQAKIVVKLLRKQADRWYHRKMDAHVRTY